MRLATLNTLYMPTTPPISKNTSIHHGFVSNHLSSNQPNPPQTAKADTISTDSRHALPAAPDCSSFNSLRLQEACSCFCRAFSSRALKSSFEGGSDAPIVVLRQKLCLPVHPIESAGNIRVAPLGVKPLRAAFSPHLILPFTIRYCAANRGYAALSVISFAFARSTETSCETPRSAMVTPNSRSMRAMVIG